MMQPTLSIAMRSFLVSALIWSTHALQQSLALSLQSSIETDKRIVQQQLGYMPVNFVAVSARTSTGVPVAIQTYPLEGGARRRQVKASRSGIDLGTPFPTLYWLTHPEIARAIADLERRGYVSKVEQGLNNEDWRKCHDEYAEERWTSLSEQDRKRLQDDSMERIRAMLQESGVAGINVSIKGIVPSVKCLHAHYADYRSTSSRRTVPNPVGAWVHRRLSVEFPHLVL